MSSNVKKIRASLIEMWTRLTEYDETEKVHLNGEGNQYPHEMELAINNSASGARASNMLAKFIAGESVMEDVIVNSVTKEKKSDIVRAISVDASKQYGCFIHVGYGISDDGDLHTINPKILDYKKCRIDKKDDLGYGGKIKFKEWTGSNSRTAVLKKSKDEKDRWYYPFNNNEDVIISQIRNDAKLNGIEGEDLEDLIGNYRGQVYYLNLSPQYIYAVSLFDPVFNDLDTEYRMSVYTNSVTRTGFLGKLAVITSGIDEEDIDSINTDIKNWLGAEESASVFRLDVEQTEDITKVLHIQQLKSQYDEKQFTETRKNCRQNILGAANNIPESLVFNSGGLFAQSGEAYRELKKFYTEQTEYERGKVSDTMNLLGFPTVIVPFGQDEEVEELEKTEE
jgi:hypothetical protein